MWDKPECGPLFGSDGFGIGLQKGSERLGRSKLGRWVPLPCSFYCEACGLSQLALFGETLKVLHICLSLGWVCLFERGPCMSENERLDRRLL